MSQPTSPRPRGVNGITAGWTAAENQVVKRRYPRAARADVLAALPGRSWNAIGLQAGALGVKRWGYWNPQRLRVLHRHYPAHGAPYVAALLKCPTATVTKQASLQGIARVRAPKPAPTPKSPKRMAPKKLPKPAPAPKPAPKPVPEPVAQHQPARLSNLIGQKALQKKEKAQLVHRSLTVAEFKQLPPDHPGRLHYLRDGVRGWEHWLNEQAA